MVASTSVGARFFYGGLAQRSFSSEGAEGAGREHLQVGELAVVDRQAGQVGGLGGERFGVTAFDEQVDERAAVGGDG